MQGANEMTSEVNEANVTAKLRLINKELKDYGLEIYKNGGGFILSFIWGEGIIFGRLSEVEAYVEGLTQARIDLEGESESE